MRWAKHTHEPQKRRSAFRPVPYPSRLRFRRFSGGKTGLDALRVRRPWFPPRTAGGEPIGGGGFLTLTLRSSAKRICSATHFCFSAQLCSRSSASAALLSYRAVPSCRPRDRRERGMPASERFSRERSRQCATAGSAWPACRAPRSEASGFGASAAQGLGGPRDPRQRGAGPATAPGGLRGRSLGQAPQPGPFRPPFRAGREGGPKPTAWDGGRFPKGPSLPPMPMTPSASSARRPTYPKPARPARPAEQTDPYEAALAVGLSPVGCLPFLPDPPHRRLPSSSPEPDASGCGASTGRPAGRRS